MTPETLIEKFFSQGLSPEEQQELDRYLAKNPEKAKAFELEKDVRKSLISKGKDELRNKLKGLENQAPEIQQEHHPQSRSSFLKYAIAAVLIIGATLFFVNTFTSQGNTSDALYAQYFEPYPNVIAPIERGQPAQTEEELIFRDYELGNYEEVIKSLQALRPADRNVYYDFYEGISLMQLGRYDEAKLILENYSKSEVRFYSKSQWYLALSYLKTERVENAKTVLKSIIREEGYKSDESTRLLGEL